MRKYNEITPIEAVNIAEKIIALLIKGFENIGFRKDAKKRLQQLEDLSILQNKRITELEKIIQSL